jgi:hypothetical protein
LYGLAFSTTLATFSETFSARASGFGEVPRFLSLPARWRTLPAGEDMVGYSSMKLSVELDVSLKCCNTVEEVGMHSPPTNKGMGLMELKRELGLRSKRHDT